MQTKSKLIYGLLLFSLISAIVALITSNFIFKSGTAGIGIIILLILNFRKVKPSKVTWLIAGAFLFSITGDWFLTNMNGDPMMFSKGIAMFFFAHIGYLLFALFNGRIRWRFTGLLLAAFLVFYFTMLYPTFKDKVLMLAALIYLLVSCLSMGAAAGIKSDPVVKWAYAFGIFLILFSDTVISLKEFLGYNMLNFMILPTYYLAHISITFSLIRKTDLKDNKREL
jgi:uncharacterized membrane protein YhhN